MDGGLSPKEKDEHLVRTTSRGSSDFGISNKFAWEVDRLRWFDMGEFAACCKVAKIGKTDIQFDWFEKGERVRPWFQAEMLYYNWNDEKDIFVQLSNGVYPFPKATDRWSLWRAGKWVPGRTPVPTGPPKDTKSRHRDVKDEKK